MKLTRRKLRRIGKWVGLVVVLMVVKAEVLSFTRQHVIISQDPVGRTRCVLYRGSFTVFVGDDGRAWHGREREPLQWWFRTEFARDGGLSWVEFPLWLLPLASALPTAWLWWRDCRDKGPGHCAKCGYDLTGLAAGAVCPECGGTRRT